MPLNREGTLPRPLAKAAVGSSQTAPTEPQATTEGMTTWDTQCSNPTMTGTGQIVREGTDAYTGTIKFTGPQGNMTINLKGKKVGGCDNPQ